MSLLLTRNPIVRMISGNNIFVKRMSSLGKGFDILGDEDTSNNPRVFVRGYGDYAFEVNDMIVRSSIILLPNSFLIWKCREMSELTLEKLAIFPLVIPTVEILFIGCGEKMSKRLDPDIVNFFRQKGIIVEAMSTQNAASTFNILNSEGRNVGAALMTQKLKDAITENST
eukprot:gene10361-21615_t